MIKQFLLVLSMFITTLSTLCSAGNKPKYEFSFVTPTDAAAFELVEFSNKHFLQNFNELADLIKKQQKLYSETQNFKENLSAIESVAKQRGILLANIFLTLNEFYQFKKKFSILDLSKTKSLPESLREQLETIETVLIENLSNAQMLINEAVATLSDLLKNATHGPMLSDDERLLIVTKAGIEKLMWGFKKTYTEANHPDTKKLVTSYKESVIFQKYIDASINFHRVIEDVAAQPGISCNLHLN